MSFTFSEPVLQLQASFREEEWHTLLVDAAIGRIAQAVRCAPALGDVATHLSGQTTVLDAIYALNAMHYPVHAIVARVRHNRFSELQFYKLLSSAVSFKMRTLLTSLSH